jgi:hypothetical protein
MDMVSRQWRQLELVRAAMDGLAAVGGGTSPDAALPPEALHKIRTLTVRMHQLVRREAGLLEDTAALRLEMQSLQSRVDSLEPKLAEVLRRERQIRGSFAFRLGTTLAEARSLKRALLLPVSLVKCVYPELIRKRVMRGTD